MVCVNVWVHVRAQANGNFGYDPPRNKYPNDGNPGITHFRDQLGTNARSYDDILCGGAVFNLYL